MGPQHRLDLAQLDAEAADLHLIVEAAEELDRAIGALQRPRSPVRYSRPPGLPPNGSGTNLSAVSAGRPR